METPPKQQAARLGKKILKASIKNIFADKSVIRVLNWGFITIVLSSVGIFIGLNIVADILINDWEAAFGFLMAFILAGILAYFMVYKCLRVSTHFSADAVYLFSLMNLFYHFIFLFWVVLTFDAYLFNEYLKNNEYVGVTALFGLIAGLIMLLIIPFFFRYKHGCRDICLKSLFVFLFKLPFVLPIWAIQAVFYDLGYGAKSVKNRLSRLLH